MRTSYVKPPSKLCGTAIYDITIPPFLNDLEVMRFGYGYWINVSASDVVTWQVSEGSSGSTRASRSADESTTSASPPDPPATYYGEVRSGKNCVPVAGMEVTAWVGSSLCGRGQTLVAGDQTIYMVHVFAADAGAHAGCGTPDRTVTFQVGGQEMAQRARWDTTRVWEVALSPAHGRREIYLPLILQRGG
jgi:hypothetical protein